MREFNVLASNITVAGTTTLIFVNNTSGAPGVNLEFLRYWAGFHTNATSGQQRIQLVTQVTQFPTVTSATPVKLKFHDAISSIVGGTAGAVGTCGINASNEGTGAKSVVHDDSFNVLNGWLYVPTPNETRVQPIGGTVGLGMYFPAAPATTAGWTAGLTFREI